MDEEAKALFARFGPSLLGDRQACLAYAAALHFAESISRHTHKREIEVWIHEPMLTRTDMEALKKLNIKIANPYTQEGYALVDEDTFVFGIELNLAARVETITLECARPALILWSANEERWQSKYAGTYEILSREYNYVGWNFKAFQFHYCPDPNPPRIDRRSYIFVDTPRPPLMGSLLYVLKPQFCRAPVLVGDRKREPDDSKEVTQEPPTHKITPSSGT